VTDRGSRARGVLRGAVLAVVITLLSAAGHVAGGGAVPDLAVLAVLLPLLAGLLATLADGCRSLAGTVGTLAAGQAGMHLLMALMTAHDHPAAGPATAGAVGPAMAAAHLLATLGTALALHGADRAILVVQSAWRRIVPSRPACAVVCAPLPVPRVRDRAVAPRPTWAPAAVPARRGPPAEC
jgi:hypothetical protein